MSVLKIPSQQKPKKTAKKMKEKIWAAQQVVDISPQFSEGEGTPTPGKPGPIFYKKRETAKGKITKW